MNRYVKGSLIVKYSDNIRMCVHCLVKQQRSFELATANGSNSLDRLHSKYGVQSAEPLFRSSSEEFRPGDAGTPLSLESIRRLYREHFERARIKYPNRAARIPRDAVMPDLHHVYVVTIAPGANVSEAVAEFSRDPDVVYAQPNYIVEAQFVPNDPYYKSSASWGQPYDDLWGLKANKLDLRDAWDIAQGEGITVAVIDTGLDHKHPDIQGNVWTNPGEVPGNKLDDDNNGYVDDIKGWDYVGSRTVAMDNDPMDDNGHGTHVSGTIAAVGNNNIGIVGVAPKAKIMAVKALDKDGSGMSSVLGKAIEYAVLNGADVLNNSWGCSYCPSNPAIEDAVRAAYALGAVTVFAAGNNRGDVSVRSPQNMTVSKPIVVGASTEKDQPVYFTAFGAQVDVVAPGGGSLDSKADPRNILSLKASRSRFDSKLTVDRQYVRLWGTSMAAPHVAGIAALMLSHNGALTNEDVRNILRASAEDIHKPELDEYTGAGRVNAAKALTIASKLNVKISSPHSGSTFSQNKNVISVRGTAGGADFDQYEVFYRAVQSSDWISLGSAKSDPIKGGVVASWNVANLSSGIYLVRLVATSRSGVRYEDAIELALERAHKLITTRRGSIPSTEGGRARISGDRIVWEDWGDKQGVYVFDLGLNKEQFIMPYGKHPDVSGNLVSAPDFNRGGILIFDFASQDTQRILSDIRSADQVRISEDHLAWATNQTPTGRDIMHCVYDRPTGTCPMEQITTDPKSQQSPAISGSLIAWEDLRNVRGKNSQNYDIYLYDLSQKKEMAVTSHTAPQVFPDVSGSRVVWMDFRNGNWDIYMCTYDPGTGSCPEQQVTTDTFNQIYPCISGDRIVWVDYRTGNPDIFVYDINTKAEKQVTFALNGQFYPRISGTNIIWLEIYSEEDSDIFFEKVEP